MKRGQWVVKGLLAAILVVMICLLAVVSLRDLPRGQSAKEVRAQSFVLTDKEGVVRAKLVSDSKGNSGLILYNSRKEESVVLFSGDVKGKTAFDVKGKTILGPAVLSLEGQEGFPFVLLYVDADSADVGIASKKGESKNRLSLHSGGDETTCRIDDQVNKRTWKIPYP